MFAIRLIVNFVVLIPGLFQLHADEPVVRDVWRMQIAGNSHFPADSIRVALSLNSTAQLAVDEADTDQRFLGIVQDQILRGYLAYGFRDAKIDVNADIATGVITATIVEGKAYSRGDVIFTGLTDLEAEHAASLIYDSITRPSPLKRVHPNLSYWKRKSAISFTDPLEARYEGVVKEALANIGYPQARFSIECPIPSTGDARVIDLRVSVTEKGAALEVGEITFTGLEKHTPEQTKEYLGLKTGMPFTFELRNNIVDRLLRSGRFLMAEVEHEINVSNTSEPLELKVRVREYEQIAPLSEGATPQQEDLIRLSDWLSNWKNGHDDMRVQITVPNTHASKTIQSVMPPMLQPLCDASFGTGEPGHFSIDAVTSPEKGSVISIQVTEPDGDVTARRTIVMTATELGLVAWQPKKKWFRANQFGMKITAAILSRWPDESAKLSHAAIDWKWNSRDRAGLRTEFTTTAAAMVNINVVGAIAKTSVSNGLRRFEVGPGLLEFEHASGALRNLEITDEDFTLHITTGNGLLDAEMSRLHAETSEWQNQCQPGHEWPSLASMILEEVKTESIELGDILQLSLAVLSNDSAVTRFMSGLEAMDANREMIIPVSDEHLDSRPPAFRFKLSSDPEMDDDGVLRSGLSFSHVRHLEMLTYFSPSNSFASRFQAVSHQAAVTGDRITYNKVCDDVLKGNREGAVLCLLMARLCDGDSSEIRKSFANAGLERLSTEAFERDIAPYLENLCGFREATCAALMYLQQSSDEEAERIVRLGENYLRDHLDQPINIRPLVAIIRSQPDKAPEDLLKSLVPVVWEGGLKSWVEEDLRRVAESPEQEVLPVAYHIVGVTPLTGSSIVATVNGKPVNVDEVLGGIRRKVETDPALSEEQRQTILLQAVRKRIVEYAEESLVLQGFEATFPIDRRKRIIKSLEPAFAVVCQKMMRTII